MADYTLTKAGVRRASDGAGIPIDALNRDWQDYLAWRAAGNVPDPDPVPVPDPPVSVATVIKALIRKGIITKADLT